MTLNSHLANDWLGEEGTDPDFPRLKPPPPGGITARYTMRLTALAGGREESFNLDLAAAVRIYKERDGQRCIRWRKRFSTLLEED